MSPASKRSVRTSVLLPVEQHLRVMEIAVRSQVSVAWVIRQAVQQLLDKEHHEQFRLPIEHQKGVRNA